MASTDVEMEARELKKKYSLNSSFWVYHPKCVALFISYTFYHFQFPCFGTSLLFEKKVSGKQNK